MAEPGDEERFALSRVFSGDDEFSVAVRLQLKEIEILARDDHDAGFVANIRFPTPLPSILEAPPKLEWYFKHTRMPHGGSFVFTYDSPELLILFANTFYGPWPTFDPHAFSELVPPA